MVFFLIMCIASFNFNLNGVEAEPVISKQFSVQISLSVQVPWKFQYIQDVWKCGRFYPFPNARNFYASCK